MKPARALFVLGLPLAHLAGLAQAAADGTAYSGQATGRPAPRFQLARSPDRQVRCDPIGDADPRCRAEIGQQGGAAPATISADTVIKVPENLPTLKDAIEHIKARLIVGSPTITIQLASGAYGTPAAPLDQVFINDPKFQFVHIKGNCAEPQSVVLNFNANNNLSGFAVYQGGRLGMIDCLTVNGIGARVNRDTWTDQAYGSGVQANGSGSAVALGSKLTVNDFYYGVGAFYGASITGRGVTANNSGDANFIAGYGAVLTCLECRGNTASHVFTNAWGRHETLGFNFMAEMGSTLYVDGSKGTDAQEASIAAQTNGAAWAHDFEGSGAKVAGARIIQNGFVELARAKLHGNSLGVKLVTGGGADLSGADIFDNAFDGILARGGHAHGSGAKIRDNGGFGIRVERSGMVELFKSEALIARNKAGRFYVEQPSGCTGTDAPCRPGSTLYIN